MTHDLKLDHRFDPKTKKHYLNDRNTVLHCHHYSTLFTEMAITAKSFGGVEKMLAVSEEVFGAVLQDYFQSQGKLSVDEKVTVAEQYWKAIGMGLIRISTGAEDSGGAEMEYSHMDAGWLKKYGGWTAPVNYITQGYLAGAFNAIYGKPVGTYVVEETKSLVLGDSVSEFRIKMK